MIVYEEYKSLIFTFVSIFESFSAGNLPFPTLIEEDLTQIDDDDLEEMDIRWQMAMIAVWAKKFFRKIGRNQIGQITNSIIGFNKREVRCFNCHQLGHFK